MNLLRSLLLSLLLAGTACNQTKMTRHTSSQSETVQGIFPNDGATSSVQPTVPITSWSKVKINETGEVFLDGNLISIEEFAKVCTNAQGNRGFILYIETSTGLINDAQQIPLRKIVDAKIPVRAVKTEAEM